MAKFGRNPPCLLLLLKWPGCSSQYGTYYIFSSRWMHFVQFNHEMQLLLSQTTSAHMREPCGPLLIQPLSNATLEGYSPSYPPLRVPLFPQGSGLNSQTRFPRPLVRQSEKCMRNPHILTSQTIFWPRYLTTLKGQFKKMHEEPSHPWTSISKMNKVPRFPWGSLIQGVQFCVQ